MRRLLVKRHLRLRARATASPTASSTLPTAVPVANLTSSTAAPTASPTASPTVSPTLPAAVLTDGSTSPAAAPTVSPTASTTASPTPPDGGPGRQFDAARRSTGHQVDIIDHNTDRQYDRGAGHQSDVADRGIDCQSDIAGRDHRNDHAYHRNSNNEPDCLPGRSSDAPRSGRALVNARSLNCTALICVLGVVDASVCHACGVRWCIKGGAAPIERPTSACTSIHLSNTH